MGFTLIADILSSGFSERSRYQMASSMVQLLGNFFFPKKDYGDISYPEFFVTPTRIHLLLGFLSLSEKFYATEPPPYAGSIALRILSVAHVSADFGPTIFPALSLTLLPTHALQSRSLALQVFTASAMVWFSLQMENVAGENLENLLRVVGDPFSFTRDTSPPNPRSHLLGPDHSEPIDTAVVLIEFASSDLWRSHLQTSNFITCEEFLSTEKRQEDCDSAHAFTRSKIWAGIALYGCEGRRRH
ncbi:hypothetical protein BJ322DRAFT_440144 [Thelephora terrestris]|uniref:Uncharacterized protein n=1 Tax=Thelephora terrestris TaxID=56493 RepID=A0A9P6HQ58_9AGAM|nr:hypothetical protein BJ322DRAFT_440144 [Thelephora terrestris]